MNQAAIIDINDASSTLSQVGASATPVFGSLLPIGLLITGILVGGLLVAAIVIAFQSSIGNLIDRFSGKH